MSSNIPLLSNVKIAAPCAASWQSMETVDGDRVHFCSGCKKNVYNLSAMSQGQAEGLLRKHEGHLCVRYYKRTDGTILTQNCPVGQAALRMKLVARSKQAALAAAALASVVGLGYSRPASQGDVLMGRIVPVTGSSAVPLPAAQPAAIPDVKVAPPAENMWIAGTPSFEPITDKEILGKVMKLPSGSPNANQAASKDLDTVSPK